MSADTVRITVRCHDITALSMLEGALRRGDITEIAQYRGCGLDQIRRILDAASDVYDAQSRRLTKQVLG